MSDAVKKKNKTLSYFVFFLSHIIHVVAPVYMGRLQHCTVFCIDSYMYIRHCSTGWRFDLWHGDTLVEQ